MTPHFEVSIAESPRLPGLALSDGISSHETVAVVSFRNVPRPMYRVQ
jgi:hypothetical protein